MYSLYAGREAILYSIAAAKVVSKGYRTRNAASNFKALP